MRKIKHILARKEKLQGEYNALIGCGHKATVSHWRKTIEVMESIEVNLNKFAKVTPRAFAPHRLWKRSIRVMESCDIATDKTHIQPYHALHIERHIPESDWQHWVDECEKEGWSVKDLKEKIAVANLNGAASKAQLTTGVKLLK